MEIENSLLIKNKNDQKQIDMYEPLLISSEWTRLHKSILRSFPNDPNLFFTYFNGGQVPLAINVPWSDEENTLLAEILFKLFKGYISKQDLQLNAWGILSLKLKRRNGIQCYSQYTLLKAEFQQRKYPSWMDSLVPQEMQSEFIAFVLSKILDGISCKINETTCETILELIGVNYSEVEERIKKKVAFLVKWLEDDEIYLQSSALKKDPLKDLQRMEDTEWLVNLKEKEKIKEDKKKSPINENGQQRQQNNRKKSAQEQEKSHDSEHILKIEVEDEKESQEEQLNNKDFKGKTKKRRRTKMDFYLQCPIFEGEYQSEPEMSVILQKISDNNNEEHHEVDFSVSSIDDISQASFWSLQEVHNDLKDIENSQKYDKQYDKLLQRETTATEDEDISFSKEISQINNNNDDTKRRKEEVKIIKKQVKQQMTTQTNLKFRRLYGRKEKKQRMHRFREELEEEMQPLQKRIKSKEEKEKRLLGQSMMNDTTRKMNRISNQNKDTKEERNIISKNNNIFQFQFNKKNVLKKQKALRDKYLIKNIKISPKKLKISNKIEDHSNTSVVLTSSKKYKNKRVVSDDLEEKEEGYPIINEFQDNLELQKRKIDQKNELLNKNNINKNTTKIKDQKSKLKTKKSLGFQLIPPQTFEEEDIEEISSENIIKRRYQQDNQPQYQFNGHHLRQQRITEQFDVLKIEQNLLETLKNEQHVVYYKIKDGQTKAVDVKQNLIKPIGSSDLPVSLLFEISEKIKFENFQVTYGDGRSTERVAYTLLKRVQQAGNGIQSKEESSVNMNTFEIEEKVEYNITQAIKALEKQIIAVLWNQYFWDRQTEESKNAYFYLFYLLAVSLEKHKEATEFRMAFYNFLTKNCSLSSFQIIGIVLFNAYRHRDSYIKSIPSTNSYYNNNNSQIIFKNSSPTIKSSKNSPVDVCDIENSIYSFQNNQTNLHNNSNTSNTKNTNPSNSLTYETSISYQQQLNQPFLIDQTIHADEQKVLEELSNRVIIFQEMLRQLKKDDEIMNIQLKQFNLSKDAICQFFSGTQSEEQMARRLFRASEIDVCSLHFSSLEIGLGLLSRLFFADDVGESNIARCQFLSSMKRILDGKSGLKETVFNEGRLHYLSALEDITGQKEKMSLLVQVLDESKNRSASSMHAILHSQSVLLRSLVITPEVILKITQKMTYSVPQILDLNQLYEQIQQVSQIYEEGESMQILNQTGSLANNSSSNIQESSYNNSTEMNLNNLSKQLFSDCFSDECYLVQLPSQLIRECLLRNSNNKGNNNGSKEEKRIFSQINSLLLNNYNNIISQNPNPPNNNLNSQNHTTTTHAKLLLIRDTLIIKAFINHAKNSTSDFTVTSSLLKKCEQLTSDPTESVFTARLLLSHVYLPLAISQRILSSTQPVNTSNQITKVYQRLQQILGFLVDKSSDFAKLHRQQQQQQQQQQYLSVPNNHNNFSNKNQNAVSNEIESFYTGLKNSITYALTSLQEAVFKQPESLVPFLANNFLMEEWLMGFLNPKADLDENLRLPACQLFLALFQYPLAIEKQMDIQNQSYIELNSSKNKEQTTLIEDPRIINKQNNSENEGEDDSDDDEDMKELGRKLQAISERNNRYLKMQNTLTPFAAKLKRKLIEYFNSTFNRSIMSVIPSKQHPTLKLIGLSLKILGALAGSEFPCKPETVLDTASLLLLPDKLLFMGKMESSNIRKFPLFQKYRLVFGFFKEFLAKQVISSSQCKSPAVINLSSWNDQTGEKILSMMCICYHLQLISSLERGNIVYLREYSEQYEGFISQLENKKTLNVVSSCAYDFSKLCSLESKWDDDIESELSALKSTVKSLGLQCENPNNQRIQTFMKDTFLQTLSSCIFEVLFHLDAFQEYKLQLFNRSLYLLRQMMKYLPSIRTFVNKIFNRFFSETKDTIILSNQITHPTILNQLLKLSAFSFLPIIQFVVTNNLVEFAVNLAIYLKSNDVEKLLLAHQLISSTTGLISVEEFCAKELQKMFLNYKDFQHFKNLKAFLGELEALKCKYFSIDNIQKSSLCSVLQTRCIEALNNQPKNNLSSQSSSAISGTVNQQRQMMSTFIQIVIQAHNIQLLTSPQVNVSNFLSSELQSFIDSLLNILEPIFQQTFSNVSLQLIINIRTAALLFILQNLSRSEASFSQQLDVEYLVNLNLFFWRHILHISFQISQTLDNEIISKINSGSKSIYAQIYQQKISEDFIKHSMMNFSTLSPSSAAEIFIFLEVLAEQTDEIFSPLIDMNGCSAIQFLNEIKNVLKEKRQIQIELDTFKIQNILFCLPQTKKSFLTSKNLWNVLDSSRTQYQINQIQKKNQKTPQLSPTQYYSQQQKKAITKTNIIYFLLLMQNLRPFQRQFILSQSFLKFYFSAAIKGKGFPEKNSPNIKINHHIIDSRDINELLRIHKSQQHLFNFINYSAFYKKLSQLSRDGVDLKTLSLLNSALFAKLLVSEEWKQRDASLTRSVVQLSFYLTKLLEAKGYNSSNSSSNISTEKDQTMKDSQSSSGSKNIDGRSSKEHNQYTQRDPENEGDSPIVHLSGKEWNEQTIELLAMLDDQGEFLFQEMNNQEKGNYIYSLAKRNRVDIISRLLPQLEATITSEQVELRSLLSTLFSLTICKVEISSLLPHFDAALLRLLNNTSQIQALSPRDFADILYCYAKHQKILGNSQLFIKIEQAAQANDAYQQQQQQQYQDPLHNSQTSPPARKLLGLFKNEREIDPLAVSGMLNSIGNFSEKKFSYDFYQRLENMLLLTRFKTPRQLSNSFRGLAQYYTPFDLLYTHFERQSLYFLSRGSFDNDVYSFSTILYFMAINGKGSLKFYQAAENFTINHLKQFNKRQLKLILFSFKSSLHYSLSRENKDKFIDHLLNVFSQFAAEEIPSVLQGFRNFEDNIQRSNIFFQLVMPKIDEITVIPIIESISLVLEIFTACRESNHNMQLKEQLPKLWKELVQIVKNPIIQEELAAQQNKLILESLKQFFVESQELLVFLPQTNAKDISKKN